MPPVRTWSTSAGISLAVGTGGATPPSSSLRSRATAYAASSCMLRRPTASAVSSASSAASGSRRSRHMPRARHPCSITARFQPMPDEVMHVARDPPPLLEQRLLGQLPSRGLELGRQLALTRNHEPDHPRKGDPEQARSRRRCSRVSRSRRRRQAMRPRARRARPRPPRKRTSTRRRRRAPMPRTSGAHASPSAARGQWEPGPPARPPPAAFPARTPRPRRPAPESR